MHHDIVNDVKSRMINDVWISGLATLISSVKRFKVTDPEQQSTYSKNTTFTCLKAAVIFTQDALRVPGAGRDV